MFRVDGLPIVLCGPSGVGKDTLIQVLMNKDSSFERSISMTTRSPRPQEEDGRDYFFVSEKEFQEAIQNRDLLEWAKVYDHYYGTPKEFISDRLGQGKNVLFEIDIQGAANIRLHYPDSRLIYILPPSMDELRNRLRNRPNRENTNIEERLAKALRWPPLSRQI